MSSTNWWRPRSSPSKNLILSRSRLNKLVVWGLLRGLLLVSLWVSLWVSFSVDGIGDGIGDGGIGRDPLVLVQRHSTVPASTSMVCTFSPWTDMNEKTLH